MKRYDYERYYKKKHPGFRFAILDRKAGLHFKIATVYDVADAELICAALNEVENDYGNNVIRWRNLQAKS